MLVSLPHPTPNRSLEAVLWCEEAVLIPNDYRFLPFELEGTQLVSRYSDHRGVDWRQTIDVMALEQS
jgi:hypothetical protein